jgi:hypothetical protein
MPLDPSIISGIKPAQFDMAQFSPMNALTSAMKFRQADEESQLNALKRKEYENTRLQQENLNKFVRGGEGVAAADFNLPEARRNLLGFGKPGADFSEALGKQETAALTQKETQFKVQKARKDFVAQAQRDTSQNPSDANITAFKEDLLANPLFNDDEKKQMAAGADRILAMPVSERAAFMASQGASASELKPTLTSQNLGGTTQITSTPAFGGPATVVPGSVQTVTMTPAQKREAEDSKTRIKQEGQRIGLEGRRVAVAEENARRDKDPVFQQQMAAAKATGTAIAQGDIKAVQALPKIISDGQMAIDLVDQMVGKQAVKDASGKVIQAATKPHPGFQDAVGSTWKPGFRFIPGTDAATFQTFQDQIEGTAFLSAFESLKGGGAISEKEGAKATAARLRMKTASDEKGYMEAAREFQEVVRKGVETARRRVPGAAPAAGGVKFLGFE